MSVRSGRVRREGESISWGRAAGCLSTVGLVGFGLAMLAVIALSSALKACTAPLNLDLNIFPPTSGHEWCGELRPVRPFLSLVDKGVGGPKFPAHDAQTFRFQSILLGQDMSAVTADIKTVSDALSPGADPSSAVAVDYRIPALEAPEARAAALRLDGYCREVER